MNAQTRRVPIQFHSEEPIVFTAAEHGLIIAISAVPDGGSTGGLAGKPGDGCLLGRRLTLQPARVLPVTSPLARKVYVDYKVYATTSIHRPSSRASEKLWLSNRRVAEQG